MLCVVVSQASSNNNRIVSTLHQAMLSPYTVDPAFPNLIGRRPWQIQHRIRLIVPKFLRLHSKAKRRAPAYSLALRQITEVVQKIDRPVTSIDNYILQCRPYTCRIFSSVSLFLYRSCFIPTAPRLSNRVLRLGGQQTALQSCGDVCLYLCVCIFVCLDVSLPEHVCCRSQMMARDSISLDQV